MTLVRIERYFYYYIHRPRIDNSIVVWVNIAICVVGDSNSEQPNRIWFLSSITKWKRTLQFDGKFNPGCVGSGKHRSIWRLHYPWRLPFWSDRSYVAQKKPKQNYWRGLWPSNTEQRVTAQLNNYSHLCGLNIGSSAVFWQNWKFMIQFMECVLGVKYR